MNNLLKVSRSVNTIAGLKDSLFNQLGMTYIPNPNITLNKKYSIAEDEEVPVGYPTIHAFGIGIEGEYNIDTDQGSEAYDPSADELDLYTPIPFRIVPVDEDLISSERAMYRLREKRNINGIEYFLYWLKLIEKSNVVTLSKTTSDGSTVPFTIDPVQLYPEPTKAPSSGGVALTETINAKFDCILRVTGAEVLEVINIMFNDLRKCKISEFGIYSGIEKTVIGLTATPSTIEYTELLDTKLVNKTCCQSIPLNTMEAVEARKVSIGSHKSLIIG